MRTTSHIASEDYPELEDILEDRLPPRRAVEAALLRKCARYLTVDEARAIGRGELSASDFDLRLPDGRSIREFAKQASWDDIQAKAHDIFKIGGVNIIAVTDTTVAAHVLGNHGTYETDLQFAPGSSGRAREVVLWDCTCPWALYAWGRSGQWKKYEGRMCSHALALYYQFQSDPKPIEDSDWDTDKITEYIAPPLKECKSLVLLLN